MTKGVSRGSTHQKRGLLASKQRVELSDPTIREEFTDVALKYRAY